MKALKVSMSLLAALAEFGVYAIIYGIAFGIGKLVESSNIDATPVLVVLVIGWFLYVWRKHYTSLGK